jgi:hypothetical protein
MVEAVDIALNAGVQGGFESYTWAALEPKPQSYALDELRDGLDYLGKQRNLELLLGIQVINTTARELPADLGQAAIDSPQVKQRFHKLIDAIKSRTNSHLKYVSIGNEVDVYLSSHTGEWAAYRAFYEDALDYVHSALPGVKVGVTVTFDGAVNDKSGQVAELSRKSDVVINTYYPLGERFKVRPPASARTDLNRMVQLAKGRPLLMQEVGYPTASELSSSEAAQADFVSAVFAAWKEMGAAIPFLNYFLMHDVSQAECNNFAQYYGLAGDANFKAYLCTLGLRQRDGRPKLGWKAFEKGAAELKAAPKS